MSCCFSLCFGGPTYCDGSMPSGNIGTLFVGGVDATNYLKNSVVVWYQELGQFWEGKFYWHCYLQRFDPKEGWISIDSRSGYTSPTSPSRRTFERNGNLTGTYRIKVVQDGTNNVWTTGNFYFR